MRLFSCSFALIGVASFGQKSRLLALWCAGFLLATSPAQAAAPVVSQHLRTQLATVGETAVFTVQVSGGNVDNYRWLHNGEVVVDATGPTLNMANVQRADAGWVRVEATGPEGTVTSVAHLHVAPENGAAVVWGHASSSWAAVSQEARFVQAVAAGRDFNVALIRGGRVVAWGNDDYGKTAVPPDLDRVVAIAVGSDHSLALRDDGTVVAWGGENNTAGMTAVPPGLTDVVAIGAGANLSSALKADGTIVEWGIPFTPAPAEATGLVTLEVRHFHSYALRPDGTLLAWGLNQSGEADLPVDLGPVRWASGGDYFTLVVDADGAVRGWGQTIPGDLDVPTDLPPVWKARGGLYSAMAITTDDSLVGWGNSGLPLTIPAATIARTWDVDVGIYDAIALVETAPPEITLPPRAVAVRPGESATFDVLAKGLAPLTYRWLHDGEPVPEGPRFRGQDAAWLRLTDVNPTDAGEYVVEVTNAVGTTTTQAVTLHVGDIPTIVSGPPTQLVTVGQSLTLDMVATGTGPLTYQWFQRERPIDGATTASWTIPAVARADAGSYRVEVTDAAGATVRHYFALRVTEAAFERTTAVSWGSIYYNQSVPDVRDWSDVVQLEAVSSTSGAPIMALDTTGRVALRGYRADRFSLVPENLNPVAFMAAGYERLFAVDTTGALWVWRDSGEVETHQPHARIISFLVTDDFVLGVRDDGRILFLAGYDEQRLREALPEYIPGLRQLAALWGGVLALDDDGTVELYPWAEGTPPPPAGLDAVVSLATGAGHALALREDGSVVAWGSDQFGQLQVPSSLSAVVSVHATINTCMALQADGTLVGWGENNLGLLNLPSVGVPFLDVELGKYSGYAVIPGAAPAQLVVDAPTGVVATRSSTALSVTATGSAPLTYQWFKDGVAIFGETGATLDLPNLRLSDAAVYTVRVRNALGEAWSEPVMLAVEGDPTAPELRSTWSSTAAMGEEPVVLAADVTGGVPLAHQWYYGTVGDTSQPVAGGDAATLVDTGDRSGRFWLRSTNAQGTLDSSEGVLMRWMQEDTGIGDNHTITTAFANGRFFALDGVYLEQVRVSETAGEWTPTGNAPRSNVSYAFGRYYAPTRLPRFNQAEYCTSVDGVNWTVVDLADVSTSFSAFAYNGSRLVAVAGDGGVFASTDGATWTQVATLQYGESGTLVVTREGGLVFTSRFGWVARSADGVEWSSQEISGEPDLEHASYGDGRIVSVTVGFVYVSDDDGLTWTRHALPSLPQRFTLQSDVAYGAGVWVAVQGPHVLISLDGIQWSVTPDFVPLPVSYGSTFLSVTYGNGEFIITGQEGRILRSLPLREALRNVPAATEIGITAGGRAELVATAAGSVLGYQWYVGQPGDTSQPIAGATGASYTTPALTETAVYWARIRGASETVDGGPFRVVVATPPQLVASPEPREAVVGQALELSVEVASEAPLTYQWFIGDSGDTSEPIAGATAATLSVPMDAFTRPYWVRATNAAGSVDSASATVTRWDVFNGHRAATDMVEFQGRWFSANGFFVQVSGDGRDWSTLGQEQGFDSLRAERFFEVDGRLVASSSGGLWWTSDGDDWELLSRASGHAGGLTAYGAGVWVRTFPEIRWSTDGEEWNYLDGGPSGLNSLLFADDRFVAVGVDGTNLSIGRIYSSFDGRNWVNRSPALSEDSELRDVAHGSQGFVSVGEGGTIVYSADGLSWTDVSPTGAAAVDFSSVAWGADRYVAGVAGASTVWWSADGVTWQEAVGPAQMSSDSVFYIAGRFRAEGAKGWAYESPDAVAWSQVAAWPEVGPANSQSLGDLIPGLAAGNDRFLLLAPNPYYSDVDTRAYTSPDGTHWTEVSSPGHVEDGLVFHNGWFVTSARVGSDDAIRISRDGTSWQTALVLAQSEQLRRFVATDDGLVAITSQSRIYASADAETWAPFALKSTFTPDVLASSGARFVAPWGSSVYVSSDLVHWAQLKFPFSVNSLRAVAYGNGRFVVSDWPYRNYYASRDGVEWSLGEGPDNGLAEKLAFADGRFISLDRNQPSFSSNGSVWRRDDVFTGALAQSGAQGRFPAGRAAQLGEITLLVGGTHFAVSRRDPSVGGIIAASGSLQVSTGDSVQLTVDAIGTDLTYQWYRGESGDTAQPIAGATAAVLDFAPGEITSNGTFWVRVTSGSRSWSSETLPVQVQTPPVIVTQPVGGEVPVSGMITLSVAATGSGTLNYRWWRNGEPVPYGGAAAQLQLSATAADIAGEYVVGVYDEYGAVVSQPAVLTIPDAPQITTQPIGVSVAAGGSATFSVDAVGSSLSYQWRRNGVPLADSTSASLSLSSVAGEDAGAYDVVVRNRGGVVTSQPAQLTVEGAAEPGPALIAGMGALSGYTGGSVLMPFRIDGSGTKRVLLRAVGPAIGVIGQRHQNGAEDPRLVVRDRAAMEMASNEDWNDAADAGDAVREASAAMGALPLAEGSADAALVLELAPGTYVLDVRWSGAGTVLPEVWDLDLATEATARLAAVGLFPRSLSYPVRPTLGFLVAGSDEREVVTRYLGPALDIESTVQRPAVHLTRGSTPVTIGGVAGWDPALWPDWLLEGVRGVPVIPGELDAMRIDRLVPGAYQIEGWLGYNEYAGFGLLEALDPLAKESPYEIAVLVPLQSQTVLAGYTAKFETVTAGPLDRTFQWYRDGQPVEGATSATLKFENAQPESEGVYTLTITAGDDTVTTSPVELDVIGGGPVRANHTLSTQLVARGDTVAITVELVWDAAANDVGFRHELPAGWQFVSDDAATATAAPTAGDGGTVVWRFGSPTQAGSLTFTYTLRVPLDAETFNYIWGEAIYSGANNQEKVSEAMPYWSWLNTAPGVHDADSNGDRRLDLAELLRMIELYNTRFGTTRTGRYRLDESTADGFATDSSGSGTATLDRYHTADTDRDGMFSLSELLRVIELYNTRSGTTRTGAYRISANTADGFMSDS